MPAIDRVEATAYTIPVDLANRPETDGTLAWEATTIVVVEAHAGGEVGVGYTYEDPSAAMLINGKLAGVVQGCDALKVGEAWDTMVRTIRNLGRPGVASCAISAVDIALWDLKGKLLGVAVATLVDQTHDAVPIYGSGGFTSYTVDELQAQLAGWADQGIPRVKMKVGRDPAADPDRVGAARAAIGPDTRLFVDANGAWSRKQALRLADELAEQDVRWLEEPVSSDDLAGLRLLRDRGPPGMDIAAGEYGYDLPYFRDMLAAGAVDCLQADVTRCGGITGFLRVGALCDAATIDLSAHCAPQASAHACVSLWHLRHLEYFHDHARIEGMLFAGALDPAGGTLRPDLSRPGLGIEFKRADADAYAA